MGGFLLCFPRWSWIFWIFASHKSFMEPTAPSAEASAICRSASPPGSLTAAVTSGVAAGPWTVVQYLALA